MIISCPNCSTTYKVDDASLGPQGKSVRCSNCEQQWHQLPVQAAPARPAPQPQMQPAGMIDPTMLQAQIQAQMQAMAAIGQMPQPAQVQPVAPPAPAPAPEPEPMPEPIPEPEPLPEPEPEPEPEEDPLSQEDLDDMFGEDEPEAFGSLMDGEDDEDDGFASLDDIPDPDPIPESLMSMDAYDEDDDDYDDDDDDDDDDDEGGSSIGLILGIIFLLLIIGTAAGGFFLRDMIQEMVPQTKSIYKMIGLGENLGAGLTIEDVRSQRAQEGDVDVLVISGNVANISEKPRMVPLLRISLFNGEQEEVQFLNLTPDMAEIPPGEKMSFKGSIMDPAATARKMEVTFTEPEEMEKMEKMEKMNEPEAKDN